MTFGKKLKTIRENRGLSQRQLGEKMGITQQTVAQYEKIIEQPKLATIRRLAEALEVPLSDLIMDWSLFSDEEIRNDWGSAKITNIKVNDMNFSNVDDFHEHVFDKLISENLKILNKAGKFKLANYASDLTKIPEYRKEKFPDQEAPETDPGSTETDFKE